MKSRNYILFNVMVLLIACGGAAEVSGPESIPVTEVKLKSGDVTLFVRVVGDPETSPVMIALNGGPGMSSHYMSSMERLAGSDLAVVTFDQRGTGRSTESAEGYALSASMADIEAIQNHLKKKKVHLFGHSFGGILAQWYASLHPDRVRSLILMGSGPPAQSAIAFAQMKLGQRIQQLIQKGIITGPQPTEPVKLLAYILPAYFSDPAFPIPEEMKQSSFHPEVAGKTYTESGAWDFREEEKAITCPVLFLWGEDDPFGLEMADQSKGALVNAPVTFVILKKCGHYWQENMDDFFAHIRKFIKESQ